jgi:hypothetical protein
MKKPTRPKQALPSSATLRELPEIDFTAYRVVRNPYAKRIQREGIELEHDGPSRTSLAAIPEADLGRAVVRTSPYARRIAAEGLWIQVGRGRPRRGLEVGPTPARSVRLPETVWKALEAEARREKVSLHAVLRYAVGRFLADLPRSRASEPRTSKRRR